MSYLFTDFYFLFEVLELRGMLALKCLLIFVEILSRLLSNFAKGLLLIDSLRIKKQRFTLLICLGLEFPLGIKLPHLVRISQ